MARVDRKIKGRNGGTLNGGGREKGVANKTTRILKEAILMAAEIVGRDGKGQEGLVGYLTTIAMTEPRSFVGLLGRVLPLQITGKNDGPIQVQDLTREQVAHQLRERGIPVEQIFLPAPIDDVIGVAEFEDADRNAEEEEETT